jgi:hypothetical protein
MGITARNPEEQTRQQGSGELLGAPPSYATGEVNLESVLDDGTVVRHRQQFEAGRLVDWKVVGEAAAWAIVRPGPPELPCPHARANPEEVEAVSVRIGDRVGPLPPLDDLAHPDWDRLPYVPDATARLRFELSGSPVGRVLVDIRYQDGKRPMAVVVSEWPERTEPGEPAHDAPEMRVTMTFRNYLRMRAGELTALEAIADGGDVGETRWTMLLLLHGLLQEDAYVEAYRSLPVLPAEAGWWGEAAPFVPSDARPS